MTGFGAQSGHWAAPDGCIVQSDSKRPFLARGLGFDAYWLPFPRQEFVEAAGGMTVGHALQDV
jgi:hypothetical protein